MKVNKQERIEAIAKLREWLKPGDTVYTILRHVSRSGMRRGVGVVVRVGEHLAHPNALVSRATGFQLNKRGDGVVVGGCGTDAGFEVVYHLSLALFCPADKYDHDAAYALRQEWL